MPRGFKMDTKLTKRLFQNGLLLDKRSFIGYDTEQIPHLLLYGEDISMQRARVFQKSKGRCAICRRLTLDGEMDHIKSGNSGRCDCADHNLRILCPDCHRSRHVQVKFGSGRAQAIKDFERIQ